LKAFAKINHKQIDILLVTTWHRFSRNTTDAFNELVTFKQFGIEVQSIQQPIDFSIPESKVLLSIYLTLPEVDNDRRSMKIREGIRAALKSGRWSRTAPVGYNNNSNNKPRIVLSDKAFNQMGVRRNKQRSDTRVCS
jgi:site-specific DNA recombinase